MNFFRSDRFVIAGAAVIVAVLSIVLYLDFTFTQPKKTGAPLGTVRYKLNTAQRRYAANVVWQDLSVNEPVYENDAVMTAKNAAAVIRLNDGSDIGLNPDTMVVLSLAQKQTTVRFEHGSIFTKKGSGGASALRVVASNASVIVNGDASIRTKVNGDIAATVSRGDAEIRTGNDRRVVTREQSATVVTGERIVRERQQVRLISPSDNEFIVTGVSSARIRFAYEAAVPGCTLDVARDALFQDRLARDTSGDLTIVLSEGTYVWRVVPPGEDADAAGVRRFTVTRMHPAEPVTPQNGERITIVRTPQSVRFSWRPGTAGTSFLEIAADAGMTRIGVVRETPLTAIGVELPAGTYYWRVKTKSELGGRSYAVAGDVSSFVIARRKNTAPELTHPLDRAAIAGDEIAKSTQIFSSTAEGYFAFMLVIARDEAMRDVVFRTARADSIFPVKEHIAPGTYFWRIDGKDADGGIVSSAVRRFTVTENRDSAVASNRSAFARALGDTAASKARQTPVTETEPVPVVKRPAAAAVPAAKPVQSEPPAAAPAPLAQPPKQWNCAIVTDPPDAEVVLNDAGGDSIPLQRGVNKFTNGRYLFTVRSDGYYSVITNVDLSNGSPATMSITLVKIRLPEPPPIPAVKTQPPATPALSRPQPPRSDTVDTIRLINGSAVEGAIIRQTDREIYIRTSKGVSVYKRELIESITYRKKE